MFDLPPPSGEPERALKPPTLLEKLGLETLSEVELVRLRAEIDRKLPIRSLQDINMERELVLQLITVQNLQHDVLSNEAIPANQQAQTANTVAAALATLAKLQGDIYTSERLKKVEQALIECLQDLPKEAAAAFLDRYEALLEERGL